MKRLNTPTPHIGKILLGLSTALGLFLWVESARAAEAAYNPEGSPLPTPDMQKAIRYAAEHAWSQYTSAGASYTGLTGSRSLQGGIIVRWQALGKDDSTPLATAAWEYWTASRELLWATITLNSDKAEEEVTECTYEMLVHEFGHVFALRGDHSPWPDDVMFKHRDWCRSSPSLADLQYLGKPVESCQVELTPHGALEYLDYKGKRIRLGPAGEGAWELDHSQIYQNPQPMACQSVYVDEEGFVWVEVGGFEQELTVLKLKQQGSTFTSIPLGGLAP